MRSFTALSILFLTSGCIVQGGGAVSGGSGADSAEVLRLKKRLEQLESRVERMSLSGGAAATVTEKAIPGGQLNVSITDPATLNPILDTIDFGGGVVGGYVLEGLVDYDPRDLKLYGRLAEKWDISDDQLTVTFTLRPNVKWQDGKAFSADDVLFTWKALRNPAYTTSQRRASFKDVESLEKVDDRTIRVRWKQPYFRAVSVFGDLLIMPKHVFEADKTDFNKHPFHRKPLGTGPYTLETWKTGDRIVLKRHKEYWGTQADLPLNDPAIETLNYINLQEPEVVLQSFKRGDIDFMGMSPDQFEANEEKFRADPSIKISQYALPSYTYAVWNTRKSLFKDKKVRQALLYAINRDGVIEQVYRGVYKRITGPILPESPSYDRSLEPRPFDLAKAGEMLTEAGWNKNAAGKLVNGEGKEFTFKMSIPSSSKAFEQVATIYKKDLSRLGITMDIERIEWATFLKVLNEHNFDIAALGWRLGVESDQYDLWHSSQAEAGQNYAGLARADLDKLLETIRRTLDADQRVAMERKLHQIIYDEAPYIFIARPAARVVSRTYVKNFRPLPITTVHDNRDWWIDQKAKQKQNKK